MFHLIPAPLHRAALRLAHAVRRRWWRLAQVQLNGCRIVAFDDAGRILLIRHSYGSGNWMLPGGGIGRREDPLDAAARELVEETGCRLENARLFAVVEEPLYGTVNRVHLVTGRALGTPCGDGREVIELGFFASDSLPAPLSPALERGLPGWLAAVSG
ncbi:MAG: NUDIX domain-containing protein [Novosphingobium sp.]